MKYLFAIVTTSLLAITSPAFCQETAPALAKAAISATGAEPWATVTYPDDCLVVEFKLDPYGPLASAELRSFKSIAKTIVPSVFEKFSSVKSVQITATERLHDKRGNENEAAVVVVKFRRDTSPPIHWDKVRLDDVIDIADSHWVHPVLR